MEHSIIFQKQPILPEGNVCGYVPHVFPGHLAGKVKN
jgi:hypothetical protein